MRRALFLGLLFPLGAQAETTADILARAEADCAALEGKFEAGPGAFTQIDLTGDGKPETIVDGSAFLCDTPGFFLHGQNAGSLWVAGEDVHLALYVRGWQLVQTAAGPALQIWVGGGESFEGVAPPHAETLAWNPKTKSFDTVAAP